MAVKIRDSADPYENLANQIILTAVDDYRTALKKIKNYPANSKTLAVISELETFFHSDWFAYLTDLDGSYLMKKIREQINEWL